MSPILFLGWVTLAPSFPVLTMLLLIFSETMTVGPWVLPSFIGITPEPFCHLTNPCLHSPWTVTGFSPRVTRVAHSCHLTSIRLATCIWGMNLWQFGSTPAPPTDEAKCWSTKFSLEPYFAFASLPFSPFLTGYPFPSFPCLL